MMKLLGLSLGAIIFAALLWTTLHFWGQGLQYEPYQHPMMNLEGQLTSFDTNSFEKAQEFITKNPTAGLYLNLHMSADGQFFTAETGAFDFLKSLMKDQPDEYKGNKHYYYNFEFLKSKAPQIVLLNDWIQLKPKFWIFDLQDNALEVDKHFIEWMDAAKLQDQTIVRSDIDLIVSSLKEKRPLWIYGSTLSDLNKLLTLGSIRLEGIANFQRDYFFSPLELNDRWMINEDVLREVRKRHKKIALGPVHTDLDREKALALKPDILIVHDFNADKKIDP